MERGGGGGGGGVRVRVRREVSGGQNKAWSQRGVQDVTCRQGLESKGCPGRLLVDEQVLSIARAISFSQTVLSEKRSFIDSNVLKMLFFQEAEISKKDVFNSP